MENCRDQTVNVFAPTNNPKEKFFLRPISEQKISRWPTVRLLFAIPLGPEF